MATVQVGCKVPTGFIMEIVEPGPSFTQPLPRGKHAIVKGPNSQHVARINPLTNAFVLTEVDEELARKWFERNKDLAMVVNGQVFIQEKPGSAPHMAKERAGIETGFEPLHPVSDARLKKEAPKAAPDFESMPKVKQMVGA